MLRHTLIGISVVGLLSGAVQATPGFGIRPSPILFINPGDHQDIYIEAVGEGSISGMNLFLYVSYPGFELSNLRVTGAGTVWDQTPCTSSVFDYAGGHTPSAQWIGATVIPEHPVQAPGVVAVVHLDYVWGLAGVLGTLTTDLTNDPFVGVASDWGGTTAAFQATAAIMDIPEPASACLLLFGSLYLGCKARNPVQQRPRLRD